MKTLLLCLLCASVSAQVDKTIEERAAGFAVVQSVVKRIQSTCIFPDDKLYLSRWALVASADGTKNDTFRSGFNGGIWQVIESKFVLTKQVSNVILRQVQTTFGINWTSVVWKDLLKPLYSGLAARLWLHHVEQTQAKNIPSSIYDQAVFWAADNPGTENTANKFQQLANKTRELCNLVADVAFMIDGSGSVHPKDFDLVKQFVIKTVSQLNVGSQPLSQTRVSLTVFDGSVYNNFNFHKYSSFPEYERAISSVLQHGGGTRTDEALNYLADKAFLETNGARDKSIPKVAVIVTDGVSTDREKTKASASRLLKSGVKVFVVGVGSNIISQELEEIASKPICTHLTLLKDFKEFDFFVRQIEMKVCDVPTILTAEKDFSSEIFANTSKYYNVQITKPCQALTIYSTFGEAKAFYALDYQPSKARNDYSDVLLPFSPKTVYSELNNKTLFITVEASTHTLVKFKFADLKCKCPSDEDPVSRAGKMFQCVGNPFQYHKYQLKKPCEVLTISTLFGKAKAFYALDYQPSKALNDYSDVLLPFSPKTVYSELNKTLFITVEAFKNTSVHFESSRLNCTCPSDEVPVLRASKFYQCVSGDPYCGYNCLLSNPCFPSLKTLGKYYYPHINPNMYVKCCDDGVCEEFQCVVGMKWNDGIKRCEKRENLK